MERTNIYVKTKLIMSNIMETLKILSKYNKKYIIILIIANIVISFLPFLSIIISQEMLNMLQIGTSVKQLIIIIMMYSSIKLVSLILNNVNTYYLTKYNDYLYYQLNVLFLNKCSELDYQDFENPLIYDSLQRAEQQIGVRPFSMVKNMLSLMSGIISFVISMVILSNWHLWSLIGFIILPIASYKYFVEINKKEYDTVYKRAEKERKTWYLTHLIIKDYFIKEVKMLNLSKYFIGKFDKLKSDIFNENVVLNKRKVIFNFLYQTLNTVFSLIIVAIAMLETLSSKILLGNLMTYINTTAKVETAVTSIASSCFALYTDSVYCEYILSFFRILKEREKRENEIKIQLDHIDQIELINVSYKYKNRKEFSLKNISLRLESGQINALVGENGSGKTTLIKILTGLYLDYGGTILVNGIDLKKLDIKDYQQKMSTVFQDYNNYEFDVKDNIGVGNVKEIDNINNIKRASKLTGADKVIEKLPNKYTQQLGNWFTGGIQLSGGQWQKIAIARSLTKDASMYILDEPTAALDPSAEYTFFKNFKSNIINKIGVFVTHRFSNVKIADNIFVLKDGILIENGSHKELMNKGNEYAKLYKIQIGELV